MANGGAKTAANAITAVVFIGGVQWGAGKAAANGYGSTVELVGQTLSSPLVAAPTSAALGYTGYELGRASYYSAQVGNYDAAVDYGVDAGFSTLFSATVAYNGYTTALRPGAQQVTAPSTTIGSRVGQAAARISDDALVNFGSVARAGVNPTTGVRSYWFRYGNIKQLTHEQLQIVVGDMASAGRPGGANVMRVSNVPASSFTPRAPNNMFGIPEYIIDVPVPIRTNVPVVK